MKFQLHLSGHCGHAAWNHALSSTWEPWWVTALLVLRLPLQELLPGPLTRNYNIQKLQFNPHQPLSIHERLSRFQARQVRDANHTKPPLRWDRPVMSREPFSAASSLPCGWCSQSRQVRKYLGLQEPLRESCENLELRSNLLISCLLEQLN